MAKAHHHHHHQHRTRKASSKLKPFDWAKEREIRHDDVKAFKAAASAYDHIILVRATNEHSIRHIGERHYTPKPIDCKPKTASQNAFSHGQMIECAGLVVDPTLLPNAFTGKKQAAARKWWDKFTQGRTEDEMNKRVFRRYEGTGFYAVDTYKGSDKYGCLMLSEFNAPAREFNLAVNTWQNFKRDLMSYIYGDYDLYGLIDVAEVLRVYGPTKGRELATKEIHSEQIHGVTSFHSSTFHKIQHFLNNAIGAPMIQHGSQDTFGHGDDKLYVFTPIGNAYVLEEPEAAIREVYQLIFKEEPIERSFH